MKRIQVILFCVCVAMTVQAQLYINGHQAFYDKETNTWLATIAESQFGLDNELAVTLADGWNTVSINNEAVSGQYTFQNVTADSQYPVKLVDISGNTVEGVLQFTFLPLVQLQGDFGYEYQNGTVVIAIPDDAADNVLTARLKWRGGTTNAANKHKRNYNIKFDNDVKLFDLRKDNNWMLDAGQPDVFRMRNRIAMDIWNDMASKPYYIDDEPKALNGVRGRMVEVFLNDEYRGIYNLSEKLDRKQMKLKKADKETGEVHGVLYKGSTWENASMNDSIYRFDNYSETLLGYEVKYPEPGDDNDSTDWKPFADAINKALILCYDDKAFEEEIEEWFDVPLMIDYSVFLSTVNALDNSGKNMFWAVYDKATTHRLTLAPWDLDCTFGQRWGGRLKTEENDHTSPEYFSDVVVAVFYNFYRTNALQFNDRLNERFQQLRQPGGVLSTESLIERFTKYYLSIKNSGAASREEAKWSGDTDVWGDEINFDKEYEYICNWITQHLDAVEKRGLPVYYNKEYFDNLNSGVTSPVVSTTADDAIYTLSGQRVAKPTKPGVYIVGGRKVII